MTEKGVAADMYDFLQQFFQAHPKYAKLPFYAFGESYAGHYVPAVTYQVWQNNQKLPAGAIHINLVGTAVGNGLTDPAVQYNYYADMAISTNHHDAAVSKLEYDAMKVATVPCVAAIKACQNETAACLAATDMCNLGLLIPYTLTGMNPYDSASTASRCQPNDPETPTRAPVTRRTLKMTHTHHGFLVRAASDLVVWQCASSARCRRSATTFRMWARTSRGLRSRPRSASSANGRTATGLLPLASSSMATG